MRPESRFKILAAEFAGTLALVAVGTGAIVVNERTGGALGVGGVALAFGLIVTLLVAALGPLSGSHVNPAITLAFWKARRFPARNVVPYVLSQFLGAMAGSGMVRVLFGGAGSLGVTRPSGSAFQSLIVEFLLTFLLVFAVLRTSAKKNADGRWVALVAGIAVGLDALVGGPVSGASMNPARSFGPALVADHFSYLWIYFLGPIAGAWAAVVAEQKFLSSVHGREIVSTEKSGNLVG